MQGKNKKIVTNRESFGQRLRKLRIAKELSQVQFAALIGYKRSGSISNIENDKTPPDIATLAKITECLNVDLHWLIIGNPSLAVERLRIYASAHIADVYQKIEGLKKLRAEYELQQAVGQDRTKEIEKTDSEIMSLIKYGGDLRRHLNEVLEPIGRAFK